MAAVAGKQGGLGTAFMTRSTVSAPATGMPDRPASAARPEQRRIEDAFVRARRHSRRVRLLKVGLPVAAVVMMAAFFLRSWVVLPDGVTIDLGSTAIEDGRLVMADPRLEGLTGDSRAYRMTATRAIQNIGAADQIDLEGIDATVPFDSGNWMTIRTDAGRFDREGNTLEIDTDITVETDNGIRALLRSAQVDIGAGTLDTSEPVEISMDGGRIQADSLAVRERGAVMIFENRVRMHLDRAPLQSDDKRQDGSDGN